MNVCLLSFCSFLPALTPFYRRAEVSVSQVLTSPVQIGDSWWLHTQQCCPGHGHRAPCQGLQARRMGRAGDGAELGGETQIHRKWVLSSLVACGSTYYWFYTMFFLSVLGFYWKLFFSPVMLSRNTLKCLLQNSWQYHLFAEQGGTANKFFLMLCFNLTDALSMNYKPNSSFQCFNKCVDTDISNPTFPGQGHVSLETNWACRTLFSRKCWSHWS